jgi:hypothetical protein
LLCCLMDKAELQYNHDKFTNSIPIINSEQGINMQNWLTALLVP